MAVLDPVDVAVGLVGRERALEVAGRTEVLTAAVHVAVRVGGERKDRSIRGGVLHQVRDVPGHTEPVDRVDGREARGRRAVELGERAAEDNLLAVRRYDHGGDVVVGRRVPGEQRAVRRAERSQVGARLAVRARERAADVDGRVRRGDRVDRGVERRREGADQCTGARVERGDAVVGHAIGGGELAADVDAGAVGRCGHCLDLRVEVRRHGGSDQVSRGHVVLEQVVPRHLLGAGSGTGRSRVGEAAAHPDGAADDRLRPGNTVHLSRRQGVGGHTVGAVAIRDGRDRPRAHCCGRGRCCADRKRCSDGQAQRGSGDRTAGLANRGEHKNLLSKNLMKTLCRQHMIDQGNDKIRQRMTNR